MNEQKRGAIKSCMRALNERPIVFYPIYAEITGSIKGGLVLSQIMFWLSAVDTDEIWKTDDQIREETGIHRKELKIAKKKIKDVPFLTVSRRGIPAKTWYSIDWDLLVEFLAEWREKHPSISAKTGQTRWAKRDQLDSAERDQLDGPKGTNHYKEQEKTLEKTSYHGFRCEKGTPKTPELEKRWERYAKKLADAVGRVRKINQNSKVVGWASEIRKLHTKDQLDVRRIKRVLDWYCQAFENDLIQDNSKYLPIAYSGKSFRNKFLAIEDAKSRLEGIARPKHEEVQLTKAQKKSLEWTKQRWRETWGVHEGTEDLPLLLQSVSAWSCDAEDAMREQLRKESGKNGNYALRFDAETFLASCLPYWRQDWYLDWIAKQVSSWSQWGGSLQEFMPPHGKHFLRYSRKILRQNVDGKCCKKTLARIGLP